MRVVGLTGGIGSGKSTAARMFAALGAHEIDADQLAKEAVAPGSAGLKAIVERFGAEFLDPEGGLDRKKLGAHVFGNPQALADLNAIVHPKVSQLAMARISAAQDAPLVIYNVPLLYENGLDATFSEVIVVDISPETQRKRIVARDNLPPEQIEARISAQWPLADKVARATYLLDNNGTLEQLQTQVAALYARLTGEKV